MADHQTFTELQQCVGDRPDVALKVDAQRTVLVEGIWDTTVLMTVDRSAIEEAAANLTHLTRRGRTSERMYN